MDHYRADLETVKTLALQHARRLGRAFAVLQDRSGLYNVLELGSQALSPPGAALVGAFWPDGEWVTMTESEEAVPSPPTGCKFFKKGFCKLDGRPCPYYQQTYTECPKYEWALQHPEDVEPVMERKESLRECAMCENKTAGMFCGEQCKTDAEGWAYEQRNWRSRDRYQAHRMYEDEGVFCPECGGDGEFMGQLGSLEWYRCRACGMDFNVSS